MPVLGASFPIAIFGCRLDICDCAATRKKLSVAILGCVMLYVRWAGHSLGETVVSPVEIIVSAMNVIPAVAVDP